MYAKPKRMVLLGLLALVAALMALLLSGTAGKAATKPAPKNTEPPTDLRDASGGLDAHCR